MPGSRHAETKLAPSPPPQPRRARSARENQAGSRGRELDDAGDFDGCCSLESAPAPPRRAETGVVPARRLANSRTRWRSRCLKGGKSWGDRARTRRATINCARGAGQAPKSFLVCSRSPALTRTHGGELDAGRALRRPSRSYGAPA